MRSIEFYTTPDGEVILKPDGEAERQLTENDNQFIQSFLDVIKEFYPGAYSALFECYGTNEKKDYRNFLIVRRFIKCNLGVYDNRIDLDDNWNFKFEFVSCPLRGECKYDKILCSPTFNSKLSERQMEVMKLLYSGMTDSQVADKLFISLNTVNNHRKNSFKKLGIHSFNEFMRLAAQTNMFNNN
jgi:DNA-binding CsgD family transcriptional regulator